MDPFIRLLSSHRSIRRFKEKPVRDSLLKDLVRTAQCASSSHHIQAYVIIQVKDKNNRKQLADLAGPQIWVEQAPVFLVFCADLTRLESACQNLNTGAQTEWAELFIMATVDTAILAQNLMVAAESKGLGGVFIGGIRNDPQRVCRVLNIPEKAYPVFGMCLGYPAQNPDIKPRLPLDLVLRQDRFNPDLDRDRQDLAQYDETMKSYYLNRDSNTKDRTWQDEMALFLNRPNRPHMKSFLENQGFFLK